MEEEKKWREELSRLTVSRGSAEAERVRRGRREEKERRSRKRIPFAPPLESKRQSTASPSSDGMGTGDWNA